MTSPEFVQVLRQMKADLKEEFRKVEREYREKLAAIDVLLGDDASEKLGSNVSSADDEEPDGDGRTTRELIREVLEAANGVMRMVDVVIAVKGHHSPASEDTIRSVLQKMARSGEVEKVGRGTYALAGRLPNAFPEIIRDDVPEPVGAEDSEAD
jgi:hypothetical protein